MIQNSIYFIGDIHGEFVPLTYALTKRYKLHDCSVIVCGDIGMGFYKLGYYIDTFKTMNKKLLACNIQLYMLRGNHDNPDYFNYTPQELVNFSNIHLVQDYTVLHINNHNILCVGGAASIDKKFRTKDVDWWEFENVLPYEKIDYTDIDIVCTHCAPMFCNPSYKRISWMDDELDAKSRADRNQLAKMYFDLIELNELHYWFYGHYHDSYMCELSNNPLDFAEIDKHYLMSGQTLEDTMERIEESTQDKCYFIGLNMIDTTAKLDIFELRN